MTNNKINQTYYCILCEMSGFDYTASKPLIALAKECKKFLLDNLNSQVSKGKINDPIFGCSVKNFYGHSLAWNKTQWKKSAKIVYQYFKVSALIKVIQKYELIFNNIIINDFKALLEYLYECFSNNRDIEWSSAPSISSDFSLVPIKVLDDKLYRFQELYE